MVKPADLDKPFVDLPGFIRSFIAVHGRAPHRVQVARYIYRVEGSP